MTPITRNYLDSAGADLEEAVKILKIGLASAAARSAYYCVFHAAEAFIFEQTGKIAKTHSGVRAEFCRLLPDEADHWMRGFLAKAYRFKEMADYDFEGRKTITLAAAEAAVDQARQFLDAVAARLSGDRDGEH